jgi:hypothetical protein
MSELEAVIRGYIAKYPSGETWRIASLAFCSERTVRRVKQNIREEKEEADSKELMQKPDMVNSPPHYTVGGIETIDYIQAKLTPEEFRGYLKGSCIKYSSRLGQKDVIKQDAGKLGWYANKLKETV